MLATMQSAVMATTRAKHNFKNNQQVATAAVTINQWQQKQLQLAGTKQCSVIADSDGCWQ